MKLTVDCEWCDKKFETTCANRKRGWGRFCSKPCKASQQTYGGTKAFWEKHNPSNKKANVTKYVERLTERLFIDKLVEENK